MLPAYHGEDMQVLKYQPGQKYDAHHDVGELSKSGAQLAADGAQSRDSLLYPGRRGRRRDSVSGQRVVDPTAGDRNVRDARRSTSR